MHKGPFNAELYVRWAMTPTPQKVICRGSPGALQRGAKNRPKYVMCEECGKPFKNGTMISNHRKTHEEARKSASR